MSAPLPRYFRYTLAETRVSLIGAAIAAGLASLTHLVGIEWIHPPTVGIFPAETEGTAASFWRAADYCLNATLFLLALMSGSIASYRGALKLNLSGVITSALVVLSFFPPVSLLVHGVLLLRLRKEKAYFASQEPPVVAGPKWPWVASLLCFAGAVTAQVILARASGQISFARDEVAAIASPAAVQALMDEAARDRLYFGQDFEVSVLARAQEAGQRREAAEFQLGRLHRSANAAILASNCSVLAALGFLAAWTITGMRSRRVVVEKPAGRGTSVAAWDEATADDAPRREFFLIRNGQQCGPYSESVLRSLVASGSLNESDTCWTEGWGEWKPVASLVAGAATD